MIRHATHALSALCVTALIGCGAGDRSAQTDSRTNAGDKIGATRAGLIMAPGWVAGGDWPAQTGIALSSVNFQTGSQVRGDVAVITSTGPYLSGGVEAVLGTGAELRGSIQADTLQVNGGHIFGTASYDQLTNSGVIDGPSSTPLALPLPITVPSVPDFSAGTTAVTLAAGETQALAAGDYGDITLGAGTLASKTVLTLSGGIYNVQSIAQGNQTRVECAAACEIRIKDKLLQGTHTYLGPATLSGLSFSAVQVIVEGVNGGAGGPNSTPFSAELGSTSELRGYIFVPNGTLHLRGNASAVGKFVARHLSLASGARLKDGTGLTMSPDTWVTGAAWPAEVITALNSFLLVSDVQVSGDVAALTAAQGVTLTAGSEAVVGADSRVAGNVRADSLLLRAGSQITGVASFNHITNSGGTVEGPQITALDMPVALSVPAFPAFSEGTLNVDLPARSDQALAAGSYGSVTLHAGSTVDPTVLTLTGGTYAFADLDLAGFSRIECSAPCDLQIKNRISASSDDYLGPAADATFEASQLRVWVEGVNGGAGTATATPAAAAFGQRNTLQGFVFVPNGTIVIGANSSVAGRLVAADVKISGPSSVTLAGTSTNPPVVHAPPQNTSVFEAQDATFSVVAAGSGLTYQWQRDAVDITGADTQTYTLSAVTPADSGSRFRVVVSNGAGSATSGEGVLTVRLNGPAITVQPADVGAAEGQPASFSCAASGTAVSYQWQKNATNIAGATEATLVIGSVSAADAGAYTCVASNSGGAATSHVATLSVELLAPVITQEPASQSVVEGQASGFSCAASGTNVSYQWQKDGANLSAATLPTYSITSVSLASAGQYRCVASNSTGSVTSDAAILTVLLRPPVITHQPANVTANEDASATFTCAASGTNVTYQWQQDAVDIAGATAATYNIPAVGFESEGQYHCVARNAGGSATSNAATLTVHLTRPAIVQQPVATSATEGQSASFTCAASGTNVGYRWQKSNTDIPGATAPTLTIAAVTASDAGTYRCVATNTRASVNSSNATLTVLLIAPLITVDPTHVTAPLGSSASFACSASGTNVTYRWQKNGNNIGGAAGAATTYTIANVVASSAASYRCVATNNGGSATSNTATLTIGTATPPVISLQPSDVTVTAGQSASFACAASGTSISYQWQKNTANIAGATSPTFAIAVVSLADAGQYRCIASNGAGTATSNAAALTVTALMLPVITLQPSDVTASEEQAANFACAASGANVAYQWQKGGVDIADATSAPFSIMHVTLADAGAYRCVASNGAGSATSNDASLTVQLLAPAITLQPSSIAVTEGQSAEFACEASGTNVAYRWQKGGADIIGATSATLDLAQVSYADAGSYRCIATNSGGSTTSDAALLTLLLLPPVITAQPVDVSAGEGQSASFTCAASGTLVSYRWQKGTQDIAGATAATYTIDAVAAGDAAAYRCVASNAGGAATSAPATLTILFGAPVITQQPADATVTEGESASLSCAASGAGVGYRWQKDGEDIAGASAQTFSIAAAAYTDAGSYRCVASNGSGSATSQVATLGVLLLAPAITQSPADLSVIEGHGASFACAASGTLVSYQWQHDGVDIAGATDATFAIDAVSDADDGSYVCVASNAGGSASSSAAVLTVQLIAPVITHEPSAVTATEGQSATFTCAASGTAVSYRWQKGGQDIAEATSDSFTIDAVSYTDAAEYRCVASNTGGEANSAVATLTVLLTAPAITLQPADAVVTEGASVSFRCAASGTLVSYQWQHDGLDIVGASAETYTIDAAGYADAGSYRCVATNSGGGAASDPALLVVNLLAPVITHDPSSASVNEGAGVSFTCAASGTNVSYQWEKGSQIIAGASEDTYSIAVVTQADAGDYRCVATNSAGSSTSAAASLTVTLEAPAITQQPSDLTVAEGQSASFSCAASGTLVSYHWQLNGEDIAGASSSTYTIAAVTLGNAGAYRCIASNAAASATSNEATLSVTLIAPAITTQPDAVTVIEGQGATFTCAASGTLVTYRWQKNGLDIAGALTSTYTLAAATYTDAGSYRCVATNAGGSALSNAALLSVQLIAPAITQQPADASVTEGQSVTFTCAASGTLVSYQWQLDGVDIPGASDATLVIVAASEADAGLYSCIASNSGGAVGSRAASLSVQLLAPAITHDPTSLSVTEGQSAGFTCSASGTSVTYQWQKGGQDIAGATGTTYTISATAYGDAAGYRCIATNSAGSVTSATATLSVALVVPVITTQPSNVTATEGESVAFTCAASGTLVSYRWQKGAQDISGATSASLTLDPIAYSDAGSYRCIATNSGGSATSDAAVLAVLLIAPAITTQPVNVSAVEGQSATFTCAASGTNVTYRWQKDTQDIPGALAASFTINAVIPANAGGYRCIATNSAGSASSNPAALSVQLVAPVITQQPSNATVIEGQSASLTCGASGSSITYQWQLDGLDIAGATNATYTIVHAAYTDAGSYQCVVTNSGGGAASDPAILTVNLIAPVITLDPVSLTATEGQSASFTCTASGTNVSYRWQRDQQDIAGATSSSYAIAAVAIANIGAYRCIATNTTGSATSQEATLSLTLLDPVITQQPQDVTVAEGQAITFSVQATGSQLSYQWQRGGQNVAGATSATYTKSQAVLGDDGAQYKVLISNSSGAVTSRTATVSLQDNVGPAVTVNNAPQITVNDDTITISGTAIDNTSGAVHSTLSNDRLPGQQYTVTVNPNGSFEGEIPLAVGVNVLTISVTDSQNNTTTKTITVTVAATAIPLIEIDQPLPNSTVSQDRVDVVGRVRSTLLAEQIKLSLGSAIAYPSGSAPEYQFTFSDVRLVPGPNQLTVVAQTSYGTVTKQITVTYGSTSAPASIPPVIALQVAQPEVYIVGDNIPVAGTVSAQHCVQSVKVNGSPAHVTGQGASVSFNASLSFTALGGNDVQVSVVATDCDGLSSTAGYTAHHDDGAPVLVVDGLQPSPAVNDVQNTPYRITGSITELNLAGLSVNSQSVVVLPTGTAGHWTFQVDEPLVRQTDMPVTVDAWDRAGNHTTRDLILRLDTAFELEVLAPVAGSSLVVVPGSVALDVLARAIGMAPTDTVRAAFDGGAPVVLTRAGDTASGTINTNGAAGAHSVSFQVIANGGAVLAARSINITFVNADDVPLAVASQEPANEATDVEANSPIVLHFNRAVDPARMQVAIVETVHGKIYADQPEALDILSQSAVSLTDVSRDREAVPGNSVNLPENRTIAFYPSRDFGYGGQVFVDVTYDGAALWHGRFGVRALPTLVQGFIADQFSVPLPGIVISLPELGRTATTDTEGSWSFGFGESADKMIPAGRYRARFNAGMADPHYGTAESFITINAGAINYLGVTSVPQLNPGEPFRFIQSSQSDAALLAQGDLELDLSHATLAFEDGASEGSVHVQFSGPTQTGFRFTATAFADYGYAINPGGVQVQGQVGIRIRMPSRDGSYSYIDALPDRVLLVGLDPQSLMIVPIGVGHIDRQARMIVSEGQVGLQRLDFIGVSTVVASANAALLARYAAGEIGLAELTSGLGVAP